MKIKAFIALLLLSCSLLVAQTESEPRQVRVNGYLAAQYAKSQSKGEVPDGSFQNPLMGIVFSAPLAMRLTFTAEVGFLADETFSLNQAWVGYNASQYLTMKLGLHIVPFGGFNESNLPHQTVFINFPLNVEYLFPDTWRDIGVRVEGEALGLNYAAYIGNGLAGSKYLNEGQQFQDNNANKGWGGRLMWVPDEGIGIGYSYYRGKYDNANKHYRTMQAANAFWITSDYDLVFEYNYVKTDNPAEFEDGKSWGLYGLMVIKWRSFRPYVSYQMLEYKDFFHGPEFDVSDFLVGFEEEKTRWALGAVFVLSQNVFFKFEYDFNREKDNSLKNDMYLFQIALSY